MRDHYVAGMPHLAHAGLSEHWLLKECGHRHWLALAGRYGRTVPDFREPSGDAAYAAFTALRVSDAHFERIGENASFALATELAPAGRAQHYSRHQVVHAEGCCGRVEMLSAFVRREEAGQNRRVLRAVPCGTDAQDRGKGGGALAAAAAQLLDTGRSFRAGRWAHRLGLDPAQRAVLQESSFLPCPAIDFNGAGFLYFASFQRFVEQAEWQWMRHAPSGRTAQREVYFYGNLDVGDILVVRLCAERRDEEGLAHWCELVRGCDGARIADVVTLKRWADATGQARPQSSASRPSRTAEPCIAP